jgi:hypothetical protein
MLDVSPQFHAESGPPLPNVHRAEEPENRQTEHNHALEKTQCNGHVDHRFHLLSLDF